MEPVRTVLATRELTVNINGKLYDCLLIPRERIVNIDYSEAPELAPKKRKKKGK